MRIVSPALTRAPGSTSTSSTVASAGAVNEAALSAESVPLPLTLALISPSVTAAA